ncbi:MAG: hypothetical protein FJ271_01830 [Planctomycetes bacterium]|nr:hypothetical protein [Planctomycetota bacterium]
MRQWLRPVMPCLVILLGVRDAHGQYKHAQLPLKHLPQDHAYQRELRSYLMSLREKDLIVERREFKISTPVDPEEQFRLWLLTLNTPQVGAATLPASAFLLHAIEGHKGLAMPAMPADSQMLAWLANWDQPGNPQRGSPALKRRALVLAIVDLVMLDYLYEHAPQGADRADFLGGNLIWIGYSCMVGRDLLPAATRAALDTGLKKHMDRLAKWGPRGAMTDMDLFAPVGMWYVAKALGTPEAKRLAESYSKRLFTEERFFHPAGYFVDVGCFDTSYNGISLYFATWTALASEWSFAREAVDRAHRLRAHLCLPDPDGQQFGPSHMSSRTSADPPRDQWNFPHRPYAAAMVTDEALPLAPLPSAEALRAAPGRLNAYFDGLFTKPRKLQPSPWMETHWSGYLNFPHEHYPKGHYARRLQLQKTSAPLTTPLYQRDERFLREFDRAFVIARHDDFAAVIHTGPVRGWPYGFGGGQLSAFWTPAGGASVLGRRRGMQGPVTDALEEWRTWPTHAVSGITMDGEFLTSNAIKQPRVQTTKKGMDAIVQVEGDIPAKDAKTAPAYQRRFAISRAGVTVTTTLKTRAPAQFKELRETLPLFLHEEAQVKNAGVKIEFQVQDRWMQAVARPVADVKAVRVQRLKGGMLLTFDRPRTVEVSPRNWTDGYQTRATCRTLLVGLLQSGRGDGQNFGIEYTLTPLGRK